MQNIDSIKKMERYKYPSQFEAIHFIEILFFKKKWKILN